MKSRTSLEHPPNPERPPVTCGGCGDGVESLVVEERKLSPYLPGKCPDVAVYRCRSCGHVGATSHPDLSPKACARRAAEALRGASADG